MKKTLASVAVSLGLILGACAGIDRDGSAEIFAEELDVDKDTGRCIVDTMIDAIGEDRLLEIEDGEIPSGEEITLMTESMTDCLG